MRRVDYGDNVLFISSENGMIKTDFLKEFKMDTLFDYEYSKDKIYFRLMNAESNSEFLEMVPHMPYLDLEIVFYIHIERCKGMHTIGYINNQMKEIWNMNEEGLYQLALKNMQNHLEPKADKLLNLIKEKNQFEIDKLILKFISKKI